MKKLTRRLRVSTETIRLLAIDDLTRAGGGFPVTFTDRCPWPDPNPEPPQPGPGTIITCVQGSCGPIYTM